MTISSAKKSLVDSVKSKKNRGEKSREAILLAAAELATVRGLDGLSIGELAEHLGMSKSGLYAHFDSKEDLELATIEMAGEIFGREVLTPALRAPEGVRRIRALGEEFFSHIKRKVFPVGCFFAAAAAEMGMRPGPVRDRVVMTIQNWLGLLEQCVRDGQRLGEIDAGVDAAQAAFELESNFLTANALFVITGDLKKLGQGRLGLEHQLERLAPQRGAGRLQKRLLAD